jgi:uncharacterized membrane protein YqiK
MMILLITIVSLLLLAIAIRATGMVRYIPNHRVGVVEKLFGRQVLATGFIARDGQIGFQPDVLRGGIHLFPPCQFRVHSLPLVTIPQGTIAYVFARDGRELHQDQALAGSGAGDFQDARGFLASGGQRGPQRRILREGTYAINLVMFIVLTRDEVFYLPLEAREVTVIDGMASVIQERHGFTPLVIGSEKDQLGVVTIHDGPSPAHGEMIAPVIGDDPAQGQAHHNNFQDAERFLAGGGRRGRQLQVLVEGTFYINRLFATVELIPKMIIDVGSVGVVVSYTGEAGDDLSGAAYSHGEMVETGKRGVWSAPLMPGKYAYNTYAGKVVLVPTTNIILKWIRSESGSHRLDDNLSEVSLITRDAFELSLPLSVVIHIDYRQAPLMIQRFGDIRKLIEQTLDPMISAYFKNIGQKCTVIQLLQERAEIQRTACLEMRERFARYNLELEEVLIGTPTSTHGGHAIEQILHQLRARQVAEEQVETYARQERAAVKERELREAEARAAAQQRITESEMSITIQGNEGKADYQRSVQNAAVIRMLAEADADRARTLATGEAARIKTIAGADAERVARIGVAQALAVEEQVRAYGGPRYNLTQQVLCRFAEAVEASGVELVPRIVVGGFAVGGDAGSSGPGLLQSLLGVLLASRMSDDQPGPGAVRDPAMESFSATLKDALRSPGTPP